MSDAKPSPDPSRFIASLARDNVTLDLKTVDMCFIAGLYLRADKAALVSFEEDALIEHFEQVCDVVEPGAENPHKRATHAIQRLRDQRMLARVDGAGMVRAGEYTLTALAAAVVEYFLKDEALTRESLTLLTRTLGAQLAEILAAARKAATGEAWRVDVIGPLSVTVADLVSGIQRRQRGLDAQQEEVQAEITQLISADWFGAIDRCQILLDATTTTLRELNEILMRDRQHFLALLLDIQTLAAAAESIEAEVTVQRVIEHIDQIAAWGTARQRAWSEYYQNVHRFLRDVVRLDPGRALSQRVQDQIVRWPKRPFHLFALHAPSMRLLRPLEARVDRPPVGRPRADREAQLQLVASEDLLADIDSLVDRAIEEGAPTLADVSGRVLLSLPHAVHFVAIGRIAHAVAARARVHSQRERPWAPILAQLEMENWDVARRRAP